MRLALILLLAAPGLALAQACDTDAHRQFDFWVGTWDLTWQAGPDSTATGTNTVTKRYADCVIEERFVDPGGFEGMSVSTLDRRTGMWMQTWTDNTASVLLFTGGTDAEGHPEFRGAAFTNAQGASQINRMTWRSITPEAFDWHWQRSLDDGATWTDMWVIHYQRRD